MKKLFSTLLTLVFVLSFGSVALATSSVNEDVNSVTMKKVVTITNEGTINPEETFNFTIGEGSGLRDGIAVSAPVFVENYFSITIGAGETNNTVDITLPVFTNVGVYTYPLTETSGTTAGMTYDDNEYDLVITVINNPEYHAVNNPNVSKFLRIITLNSNDKKADDFVNIYDAGKLEVSKTVTGNLGDKEKYFEVKVKLNTPANKVVKSTIGISGGSYGNPTTIAMDTETSFMLKHGETITFTNVPYGVTYTVVEKDYTGEGYNASYSGFDGAINSALDTVTITNNKNADVDTGISLDSIPYIMILGLAVLGISGLFLKRRKNTNF